MKMSLIVAGLLLLQPCIAQKNDTITVSASLSKATVYYGYGAELQHEAKAQLINGSQQVVISGMAMVPDMNTIQISCPENVTILSYYHRIFTKEVVKIKKPSTKASDTLKLWQKQLAVISNDYNINDDLLRRISALIEKNFVTDDKKNISSAELIKLTEYYSQKVKIIKEKLFELQVKRDDLSSDINAITQRINEMPPATEEEPKPTGQLILQVMAKGGGSADFDIAYFTRNAGWIPAYELRMKTIDNSLKLVYKASVTQSTGLDWKNIRLSLSTSNPNQGTTLPLLNPTYLQLYVPELYSTMTNDQSKNNSPGALQEVVVTSAFQTRRHSASQSASLQKVNNIDLYTTLKESQLNINFEIDLPYDIPSGSKSYSVAIKEEKIPATFKHYAIPKLDKDAFLMAEVSRWDSLGLLPGEANIIMDNVYLGKSFIDPNTTTDTLSLSMGRDKRISINRILVKDFKTAKEKSDNKTEQFTYEITIKNNKKQPVSLLLKDQYPISKMKEVEITLGKTDADIDTETGILTWNISLQPGESRKIRFSYSVKYPKGKTLMPL